jgi:hypothetical protein
MEKARPDIARRLDHRRNPWSVAARSNILGLAKMSAEMPDDAAQFVGALDHKSRIQIELVFINQLFYFRFQFVDFLC